MAIISGTCLLVCGVIALVGGGVTFLGGCNQRSDQPDPPTAKPAPPKRDESIFIQAKDKPDAFAKVVNDRELNNLIQTRNNASTSIHRTAAEGKISARIDKLNTPEAKTIYGDNLVQQKIDADAAKIADIKKKFGQQILQDIMAIRGNSGGWYGKNYLTTNLLATRFKQFGCDSGDGAHYMAALEELAYEKEGIVLRNVINAFSPVTRRNKYDRSIYQYLDKGAMVSPKVGALALHGAMKGEGTYEETVDKILFGTDPYYLMMVTNAFNSDPKINGGNFLTDWITSDFTSGESRRVSRINEVILKQPIIKN